MSTKNKNDIKTCNIIRHLPDWAEVVKVVNKTPIYNINIFENIMSWNIRIATDI